MSDPAKIEAENVPATYEVGYAKPPAEHRFRKGQSGNPNGRPRKAKGQPKVDSLDFGSQPANRYLIEEAYRPVAIREGDRTIELPAIQAVFRSMGVAAMKGNRFAQRTMAELVQTVEEEDRRMRSEHMQVAIEYKTGWMEAIEDARTRGTREPTPLPHPDDVIIDLKAATVTYAGPCTPEEKADWDRMIERRDEAQREVSYYAEKYRRARNAGMKKRYLDDWHSEQRMFDIINDKLPKRYAKRLEGRSYCEGASLAGDFAPGKEPNWRGNGPER